MKTAIILFVYNRPYHTQKVLEGLRYNNIKELFVFCDGIKNDSHKMDVIQTKKLIDQIDWCTVIKEYSDENKGLANSVIYGVSKVFSMGYDRVIVLEDDCIPNNDFVRFMNDCFDFYEHSNKVMHISGFGLPLKKNLDQSNYFTPYPCSWGWGTWRKYWENCDFNDTEGYKNLLKDKNLVKTFNEAGSAFSQFLEMQLQGKVNSWLIRWYFHIHKNQGLCVWKKNSSIKNNGFDGTGVHNVRFDRFNQKSEVLEQVFNFNNNIGMDQNIIKEFKRYFINKTLSERIKTIIYMYTGIII